MSDDPSIPAPREQAQLAERPGDPPVVARLVVEIRSDGTRTIARGAVEDRASGQTVSVQAEGTTPAALAASLLKSLPGLPAIRSVGRLALRALLSASRD